jgi:hypothetical protein
VTGEYPFRVTPETNPPQPEDVVRALAELVEGFEPAPDPWWQAGMEEALEE